MLFIAEIGLNHNGNLDLSFELIKQAKLAGANIAKFQLGWRGKKGELNHIDLESLKQLEKCCNYFEIEFMVSIFTEEAYELALNIDFVRYKIASRTLIDNLKLVKRITKEGKPVIISLGMWDKEEVPLKNKNIQYLWCRSKYPTTPWDLTNLPKNFSETKFEGYSDHSFGIEIPLVAISRGANIIEKHFTLDKSDTTIRDHMLSATPDEFKILTTLGKNIHKNRLIGV
jgi:N,N'-diacetyllegionaminate synthase